MREEDKYLIAPFRISLQKPVEGAEFVANAGELVAFFYSDYNFFSYVRSSYTSYFIFH